MPGPIGNFDRHIDRISDQLGAGAGKHSPLAGIRVLSPEFIAVALIHQRLQLHAFQEWSEPRQDNGEAPEVFLPWSEKDGEPPDKCLSPLYQLEGPGKRQTPRLKRQSRLFISLIIRKQIVANRFSLPASGTIC